MKHLCTVGRNVKWCSPCGKQYRGSSEKFKIELSYDLAIPLLSMSSKEWKVASQREICTPLFTAALFIIPKCLLMGEWINIMWYKYINGILVSLTFKKGDSDTCYNVDEP